ncbi:MAG: tetratricopeptide repeat protein [Gemmatimonadota bacterium]
MSRTPHALAIALAAALGLAACGAPLAVLVPAPPAEVRREAAAPPAAAVGRADRTPGGREPGAGRGERDANRADAARAAVTAPRAPDRLGEYAEACGRTQAAVARGAGQELIPLWRNLEDSRWGTDAVYNQGVLFQLAGELDEAAAQYRRAVEKAPGFGPPLANLLGIALLRGDRQQMETLLAQVVPRGSAPAPGNPPELSANAAAALMETGRRGEAATLLRSLRDRGVATPSLSWNLAVLAFREGDPATARTLAESLPSGVAGLFPVVASRFAWAREGAKVPDLGPVPPGMSLMEALRLNLAAYAAYRGGNAAGAEMVLAVAVGREPATAEFLTNFGIVQAEQGRWDAARAFLERAVRENPELAAAWLNLGLFRETYEGDRAGALECYDTYVKLGGWRTEEVRRWSERLGRSASPRE